MVLTRHSKAMALDFTQDLGMENVVPLVKKASWNLKEKIGKIIEAGVVLCFDFNGKEKDMVEEIVRRIKDGTFGVFCNKGFVFAGVHMQKDLEKLRKQYGYEVPNFVDLSQLASKVFNRPLLSACGVRELAKEVLVDQVGVFNGLAESNLSGANFSRNLIEGAAADAYAAYKIAKALLK
ncbi:hypothetical protein Dsin_021245 [Dipteronia sinensis]|uniref:Uncharacterized protein n=1 Tax=Dipteronia sinensis TaxID=43782 RepID=A0AAE0DYM9_9ROSI|nr:hypothetical protein Dsin_021245 [Dipteronia sinensis]